MSDQVVVIFDDQLLGSNDILSKSLCLMWFHGAYDIIFIPYKNYVNIKIKLPLQNGKNPKDRPIAIIDHDEFNRLKMTVKLACSLNISEENSPQTGSFAVKIDSEKYAIRCSLHPTNYGEGLCFRIIKSGVFESLDNITTRITKGLNIIGGRTCSGKTTLMYSSIIKYPGHVIALEDPVEFLIENVCQTDVSIIGYEEGIKSALRQNPDLICIGEIRDLVSAKAAIKAALTGHAVLATIHITSPNLLISRLKEFGCLFFEDVLNNIFFMDNFIRSDFVFQNGTVLPMK